MKNTLALILLQLACYCLYGQNISTATIRWNAATTVDVDKGTLAQESSSTVSYPDRIEWKASDGSLKYTFTIVRANGNWTNIAMTGQISYDITWQSGKT